MAKTDLYFMAESCHIDDKMANNISEKHDSSLKTNRMNWNSAPIPITRNNNKKRNYKGPVVSLKGNI